MLHAFVMWNRAVCNRIEPRLPQARTKISVI
jgi:hypothetical protein